VVRETISVRVELAIRHRLIAGPHRNRIGRARGDGGESIGQIVRGHRVSRRVPVFQHMPALGFLEQVDPVQRQIRLPGGFR